MPQFVPFYFISLWGTTVMYWATFFHARRFIAARSAQKLLNSETQPDRCGSEILPAAERSFAFRRQIEGRMLQIKVKNCDNYLLKEQKVEAVMPEQTGGLRKVKEHRKLIHSKKKVFSHSHS